MLRALLAWLLLVCAAPAAAQSATGTAATADPAGTVEFIEGDVRVADKAKKRRTLRAGDAIHEGDSIATGADGEIHLQMADGGLVAVRPDSRLRIVRFRAEADDTDQGIFSLLAGSIRSVTGWIGRHNARGYMIRTPTATIGIRGTDHEPLVIAPGSREGEPGTYDKVNAGATYIRTQHGEVDVPAGRAAFAPHAEKRGRLAPRLLDRVPAFFRATRNEGRIEQRHEAIQKIIEQRRDERRKFIGERKARLEKTKEERRKATEERRREQRERQAGEREQRRRELQRRQEARDGRSESRAGELRERREARQRELEERRRERIEQRRVPERERAVGHRPRRDAERGNQDPPGRLRRGD